MQGLRNPQFGDWKVGDELGRGSFASVYRCSHATHPEWGEAALKIIERCAVDPDRFQRELDIAAKLGAEHQNVVGFHDVVFEGAHSVALVMELCDGGELYDEVLRRGPMREHEARALFAQVVDAVAFCHANQVYHRDLKLENCLLRRGHDGRLVVKVADFGLSKDATMHGSCGTYQVGSIAYMAPELGAARGAAGDGGGGHYSGAAVDVWSLGVMLFVMLAQEYPFGHVVQGTPGYAPRHEVQRRAAEDPVRFRSHLGLSRQARDLICGMLTVDPRARLTITEVLAHPWMRGQAATPTAGAAADATTVAAADAAADAGGTRTVIFAPTAVEHGGGAAVGGPPLPAAFSSPLLAEVEWPQHWLDGDCEEEEPSLAPTFSWAPDMLGDSDGSELGDDMPTDMLLPAPLSPRGCGVCTA